MGSPQDKDKQTQDNMESVSESADAQQQQPVNFNGASGTAASSYASRRVTIGHGGTAAAQQFPQGQQPPQSAPQDRRGSMGSTGFAMDDLFAGAIRRPSLGFDGPQGAMGPVAAEAALFGRRDSIDSTTAALDAAILDLTRRRYSMAMGPGAGFDVPPSASAAAAASQGQHTQSPGSSGAAGTGSAGRGDAQLSPSQQGSGDGTGPPVMNSIANRQHQLQQQQRELEQRQRELELQRQHLITSMQERYVL